LEEAGVSDLPLVIITYSVCAEYWEDLWDLQPLGLFVDDTYDHNYTEVLLAASCGQRFRRTPEYRSPLTSSERQILRYVARGWSNKRIADNLSLHLKTIMNTLSDIYQKLHVENRTEATLHYWDVYHLP
jgi:DNA-binding NarL/FixJ family response regulator